MSLATGANIRLHDLSGDEGAVEVVRDGAGLAAGNENSVEEPEADENGDTPTLDGAGNVIKIDHADGSVTISINGRPLKEAVSDSPKGWYENIAEDLDDATLNALSEELMRGIADDIRSREDWLQQQAEGVKLLGLTLESAPGASSADASGVEGTSRVRHPLLLEACLRFQANARSEMLPTDGPVKIRDDNNNGNIADDQLAEALQNDFNHYLTKTAREYYPDTDRMLLKLGFGGMAFKKIYYCPLRQRPVSETVTAGDLIVNDSATDLHNAKRVTHRIDMTPSLLKRMQLLGIYRDVLLGTPMPQQTNALKQAENEQEGKAQASTRPEDRDHEIHECYCEADIPGYEHKWKGKISGLEVPWRVTIDVSSKQILSIVRNYPKPEGNALPEKRRTFVKYTFVPGFGFNDIGLLHILGNTTNAITAAWRELLDLGMFANFPGFLYAKQSGRQNTTMFRIPPGGGQGIDTQGMPINQAVMPMPYSMQHAPAMMTLVDNMAQTGQRIGGTSEAMVGEGSSQMPVGTMLAQIEQAQQLVNSVHKRLHVSQSEEFELIGQCFREHPESFWQCNKKPAKQWDHETFLKALEDCNLVPQADPNTSSHTQRIVKVGVLKGLQAASPALYDPIAVERLALQTLGFFNPEQLMAPPASMGRLPPEHETEKAKIQIEKQKADAATLTAQTNAKQAQQKTGLAAGEFQLKQKVADQEMGLASAKFGVDAQLAAKELETKKADQLMRERIQLIDVAQNVAVHPESAALIEPLVRPAYENVKKKQDELDGQ
jgi:hypothetical protein